LALGVGVIAATVSAQGNHERSGHQSAAGATWGGRGHRELVGHSGHAAGAGALSDPPDSLNAMRPITDLQRTVAPFRVEAEFEPSGDQPAAIEELARRVTAGETDVVLLGATGTGKSATTAWMIERVQRPTLVMAPNKTLAAQLANELRELFPHNAVEYFVSYYDYYQPEAYVPQTDTYIEKDSSINDEVERLRHSATNSLLTRRDVVVVASVSCIYGLGTPQEYVDRMARLKVGQQIERDQLLRRFVEMQYTRNDLAFTRGTFRVRGDTVEIIAVYEELAIRIEFFGDEIERIYTLHPMTGEVIREETEMYVFPATHYVAGPERMERAIKGIELELADQLATFEKQGKLLEAQRLRMRTHYDIEMMRQVGSCAGIENYSMHIDGRTRGSAPNCLLDYFPEDFMLVIDESHVTVPQIGAMYEGDMSRKRTLVEHGFRLPSAMDNRPLKWEEFLERIGQTVYLSATPGPYELAKSDGVVEQIIRPTGLIDPEIVVKPTKGQIDDLMHEIQERTRRDERVLVTTLTKKMAEDLTDYLLERGIRVRYLHSEVDTLRRVELLRELRLGEYDVLVGINLLREGLDLPEVSLVSILDADKEGFLRSTRSLIQTIGRAARNVSGQVHMYADDITDSMRDAIDETQRRREKQIAYNTERGIDPQPLRKRIADITDLLQREDADTEALMGSGRTQSRGKTGGRAPKAAGGGAGGRGAVAADASVAGAALAGGMPAADLAGLIQELTAQMHQAAADLHFELAARLRDELADLKKELRQMREAAR
jgi:excinuclease ABC subunit B